jgi:tetratricopeptide (TPR) repeat protein
VGQPESSPPPPSQQTKPHKKEKNNRGQEQAARNHMRSAYRFLQKGKPDHAMRELEKARNKMGSSFWFHYYMGGAYYFKGMYELAGDSWKMAYQYTNDHHLRSRLRTCQSYSINYQKGDEPSIGFLRMAIDMDRGNLHAQDLLRDLGGSGSGSSDGKSDVQVGFMRPSGSMSGEDNRYEEQRDDDDDGRNGHSKGKKGQQKDDKKHGKSGKKEKKEKKYKKIRDKNRFSEYFLIEMP